MSIKTATNTKTLIICPKCGSSRVVGVLEQNREYYFDILHQIWTQKAETLYDRDFDYFKCGNCDNVFDLDDIE